MASSEIPWDAQPDSVPASPDTASQPPQSPEELQEESRKIRRLQMVVNMVTQVIAQDSTLTVDEASEMVADTRRLALGMFPDKELAFNLIYWPRLQRLMRERYRMQ
ncbi:MAG TPA: hypothetical protein VL967_10870 [Terracidiphilus sp.]|nr:hypothetical protein [Terracidiphilus sp.]